MKYLHAHFSYFLVAILIGTAVASLSDMTNAVGVFLLLLSLGMILIAVIYRRTVYLTMACVTLLCLFGVVRYAYWEARPLEPALEEHVGEVVILLGQVRGEPDVRERATRILLLVHTELRGSTSTTLITPRYVELSIARYPEYEYGDELRVKGKILRPKKFVEDDGRVFDYPKYLESKDIRYQMFFPTVTEMGSGKGNMLIATLYEMKHRFLNRLSVIFPEPHRSLLGGLLLGGKQSLGAEWLEIFRTAGVVHIVVLSGYNMTIVSEWIVLAFRFLGFYGSLSAGGIGIVLFAIMTGGGATVVRAAIMAIIALLARATGRTYTMGRALLVAGVCMVLENPSILMFDPSFQLSFLASLGLVYVSPVIEAKTTFLMRHRLLREVFVSTLATQLMVLPLLLYQTGVLSIVSLPANMLILPAIPLTMFFGFVAGVSALLIPALGFLVALPAHALLSWTLFVAETASNIPYAAVGVTSSVTVTLLMYSGISIFLWRAHHALRLLNHEGAHPLLPSSTGADEKDRAPLSQ